MRARGTWALPAPNIGKRTSTTTHTKKGDTQLKHERAAKKSDSWGSSMNGETRTSSTMTNLISGSSQPHIESSLQCVSSSRSHHKARAQAQVPCMCLGDLFLRIDFSKCFPRSPCSYRAGSVVGGEMTACGNEPAPSNTYVYVWQQVIRPPLYLGDPVPNLMPKLDSLRRSSAEAVCSGSLLQLFLAIVRLSALPTRAQNRPR